MSSELSVRLVSRHDYERWRPLWDGYNAFYGINDGLVQSSMGHFHFFEIQPKQGGRFGTRGRT